MKLIIKIFILLLSILSVAGCQFDSNGNITVESTSVSKISNSTMQVGANNDCLACEKTFFEKIANYAKAENRGIAAMMYGDTDKNSLDSELLDSLYDDIWTLPDTIIDKSMNIGSQQNNMAALLLAAGGGIALRQSGADDRINDDIQRNRVFRDKWSDEGLAIVGGPGFHFASAGLWYMLAHNGEDEFNKARAWKLIEALSITGTITLGLKAAINDDTPNGKQWAWPSGHTASSFTVAAVLDEFYGPQVGIPAYIGAGVVGWRMMDSGDHWASDVLFGMVLGYIVGHQVAGEYKDLELAGFKVLPYMDTYENPRMGVSFVKLF